MTNGTEPINPTKMVEYAPLPEGEEGYMRNETHCYGLKKREYFAAMAMNGLCALNDKGEANTAADAWKVLAEHSVLIADSLIEALNNQP